MVLPLTPPLALISSAAMRTTWFRRPSILAMVPEEENKHPSLTVPSAALAERINPGMATGDANAAAPSPVARRNERRETLVIDRTSLACIASPGSISDQERDAGNAK